MGKFDFIQPRTAGESGKFGSIQPRPEIQDSLTFLGKIFPPLGVLEVVAPETFGKQAFMRRQLEREKKERETTYAKPPSGKLRDIQNIVEEKVTKPVEKEIKAYTELPKTPIEKLTEKIPTPIKGAMPILSIPDIVRKAPSVIAPMIFNTPEERARIKKIEEEGTPEERQRLADQRMKQTIESMAFYVSNAPIALREGLLPTNVARNILGVKKGATAEEITSAYRKLQVAKAPRTLEELAVKYNQTTQKVLNNAKATLLRELEEFVVPKVPKQLPGKQAEIEVGAVSAAEKKIIAQKQLQEAETGIMKQGKGLGKYGIPEELETTPIGKAMIGKEAEATGLFAPKKAPTKEPSWITEPQPGELEAKAAAKERLVQTGIKPSASVLDDVYDMVLKGDNAGAQKLLNTLPEPKPDIKTVIDEVTTYQEKAVTEASKDYDQRLGELQADYNRIGNIVRQRGEAKNVEGLLNREHVPEGPHGEMSSDELATAMKMDENELMVKIVEDFGSGGGPKGKAAPPISKIRARKVTGPKTVAEALHLPPEYYQVTGKPFPEIAGIPSYKRMKPYQAPAGILVQPTPETMAKIESKQTAALEKSAKQDFINWQAELLEQEGAIPTSKHITDIAKAIREGTVSPLTQNLLDGKYKDISGRYKGQAQADRVLQKFFGDDFPQFNKEYYQPIRFGEMNAAKQNKVLGDELMDEIIEPKGIKKGSKEAMAAQMYGEKIINETDLVNDFGKEGAKNIIEAIPWFRERLGLYIDNVNTLLGRVYPNQPEKLIPKRLNYFRHMQPSGVEGIRDIVQDFLFPGEKSTTESLKNIIGDMIRGKKVNISPTNVPAGVIKPKVKKVSFMYKRLGDKTRYDIIRGYLDYIAQYTYVINVSEPLLKLRALQEEFIMAQKSPEIGLQVETLPRFTNWLGGYIDAKQGKFEPGMDILIKMFGENGARLLDWANRRAKTNIMLGNQGAVGAQIFNIHQGISEAGIQNWLRGNQKWLISDTLGIKTAMDESPLINTRYQYKNFRRFDSGIINNTKKFVEWELMALDELATKSTWAGLYEKGLRDGLKEFDARDFAELGTSQMVGNRNVGEVSEMQRLHFTQLVWPFQLEVANGWWVVGDRVAKKQWLKILELYMIGWLMNNAYEKVTGRRIVFDPIEATIDALTTPNLNAWQRVGRITGEVLGSIPYAGVTAASLIPEEYRRDFFGQYDPTRFGTETLGVLGRSTIHPITRFAFPWGGYQVEKTFQGIQTIKKGYSATDTGKFRYPIGKGLDNMLRVILFGEYSGQPARVYFEEGLAPLTASQQEDWQGMVNQGQEPINAWVIIEKERLADNLDNKTTKLSNSDITDEEYFKQVKDLENQYRFVIDRLDGLSDAGKNPGFLDLMMGMLGGGEQEQLKSRFENIQPRLNY